MCIRSRFVKKGSATSGRRFEEQQVLGVGCTATVIKAIDRSTGKLRAIKVIHKASLQDHQRAQRELSITQALDHPSIIRLFEYWHTSNSLCLVTEFCSGGDLYDAVLQAGRFTELQAAHVMRQLLGAVQLLQSCCISHADLKPGNVLLCGRGPSVAKLADLGSAHLFSSEIPERGDLWSCGLILRFLLCGTVSEAVCTEASPQVRIGSCSFRASDWEHVSEAAMDLSSRLLTRDASVRWTAEQALGHPWLERGALHTASAELLGAFPARLRAFGSSSMLRRAAISAIADQLDAPEIEELRSAFMALDGNGDGLLTVEDVAEGLRGMGREVEEDLGELLQALDPDGVGVLEYTTFLAAMLDPERDAHAVAVQAAFHVFDPDDFGGLTWKSIAQVFLGCDGAELASVKPKPGSKVVSLGEVDGNGNEVISCDVFAAMFCADVEPRSRLQAIESQVAEAMVAAPLGPAAPGSLVRVAKLAAKAARCCDTDEVSSSIGSEGSSFSFSSVCWQSSGSWEEGSTGG